MSDRLKVRKGPHPVPSEVTHDEILLISKVSLTEESANYTIGWVTPSPASISKVNWVEVEATAILAKGDYSKSESYIIP